MRTALKIILTIIFSGLMAACPGGENQNAASQNTNARSANSNEQANAAKDNIDEFETMVKLPFHPEEVAWREEVLGKQDADKRVPSPNERKLTAVIKFKMDDANKIAAQAGTYKAGAPATLNPENWFPEELKALSQMSGDETLKGTVFPANDFFQAPYLDGKITRIENSNYFVLELFSK